MLRLSVTCEALAHFDLRARLSEVKVPMLIAAGAADEVVPPAVANEAADAIPRSVFRVLAGCGHLPPAEDAATVAAVLSDFIAAQELTT